MPVSFVGWAGSLDGPTTPYRSDTAVLADWLWPTARYIEVPVSDANDSTILRE